MLLSNIPEDCIFKYIVGKYAPFSREFKRLYGIDPNALWLFALAISQYMGLRKYELNFEDAVYKFKSKKEYGNPTFIALPSRKYIEAWRKIVTFNFNELKEMFSDLLSENEIKKVVEIFSHDINEIPENPDEIRFYFKPFLKIDGLIILLTPYYLIRSLPLLYEIFLRKSRKYIDSKGKKFEKLAQDTLRQLPFDLLAFNVFYGEKNEYEADAIIKFKKSCWVVEVTSHPPSLEALRGNQYHIKRDLKKAIIKCISQGKRFLENLDKSELSTLLKDMKTRGVIVIVDGVYPQINANQLFAFFEEEIPVYIINWFDLEVLVTQPEIKDFEEFLLWRVQKPMPILIDLKLNKKLQKLLRG